MKNLLRWNGRSLHKSHKGEWDFDTIKKPINKVRVHGSFFSACRRAQLELAQNGSAIKCPILFMSSNRSIKSDKVWRDEYAEGNLQKLYLLYVCLFDFIS